MQSIFVLNTQKKNKKGVDTLNKDIISFDLGCNFDYKLFDLIDKYDEKHSIKSFFGKLKFDGLPGGRAASIIPNFTFDQLKDYVDECKKRDIDFNYLINPLSLDQDELDPVIGKKLRDFLHTAYDIGIRSFTLNSPILVKYAKNEFKDIFITLGLYAYPTTIQHIEYWRSWGIDEITLDHSFNRKFDLLKKLMTQYKDSDLHLRVIANNLCLKECPFRLAHGSFTGHSDPNCTSMDYTLINCAYKKVTQPTALLTSEWIRPEDVHYYRELCEETGYDKFSLKLVDRTRTTDFLERVIKAYMTEHFDGNLLQILNWPESKNIVSITGGGDMSNLGMVVPPSAGGAPQGMTIPPMAGPPQGMPMGGPQGGPPQGMPMGGPQGGPPQGMPMGGPQGGPPMGMPMGGPQGGPPMGMPMGGPPKGMPPFRFMDKLKPEAMMTYGRTMSFPNIYIDNRKLDGFLEHFVKDYNCDKTLCANNILADGETAPNMCAHCSGWAKKAISYNEQEVAQWKALAESVLRGIETGSIYRQD